MIISHKHKFLYLAPPKCASGTIKSALNPYADVNSGLKDDPNINIPWHTTLHCSLIEDKTIKDYFNLMGWDWGEYLKFTFVRNPWDRLVSFFNFQKKIVKKQEQKIPRFPVDGSPPTISYPNYEQFKKNTEGINFHSWLINHESKRGQIKVMKQIHFCFDRSGDFAMDFVGKIENIQEDFKTVCDKIGIPHQKLPHINESEHKDYTEYYNDETREIVAKNYAKDIEYFGYEFGK